MAVNGPYPLCAGRGSKPIRMREMPWRSTGPEAGTTLLGECQCCGRIFKPYWSIKFNGWTLRQHSVRGRNTASHDKTMSILWDMATPTPKEA